MAIAASASPIREEFLVRGVAEIEALGFRCKHEESIFARRLYLAGSDERRAGELIRYLADSEVKAIVFARGGFGTARLLDRLGPEVLRAPKILCGYSDITTMHIHIQRSVDWVTFYGPMAAWDFARGPSAYDRDSFLAAVSGEPQAFRGLRTVKPGRPVTGRLAGGCMSLIQASTGTRYQPSYDGCILVLEDEGVKPYQLDRMLTHIRRAGVLDGVRALVFGEMPNCSQTESQGYELADVIADAAPDVPILMNLPAGHARRVVTIPLGVTARLDTEAGLLDITESGVS
ncbi:MAG: LD-carboxypeptidase [Acidobacteriota bacterium]